MPAEPTETDEIAPLTQAVMNAIERAWDDSPEWTERIEAEAVLAMPEMQAIREVLRRVAVRSAADADARWGLLWNDLPPSVKRWATAP